MNAAQELPQGVPPMSAESRILTFATQNAEMENFRLFRSTTSTMLRRQTRERREYIFKKSQESQERAIWERKQRIKELLAAGKPIPSELRNDVRELGGKDLVLDEAQAGEWQT